MKTILFILIVHFSIPLYAAGIRNEMGSVTDAYLQKQMSPQDLISHLRLMREEKGLSEDEKLYLRDLTEKLPLGLRHELCPDLERGLCEEAPHFQILSEVPLLPTPETPNRETTWWQRNSKWILWGAVGLAGAMAWSLKDKEIQVRGFH